MPEQRDISRLVVKLTDVDTRQKLDLELELMTASPTTQEKRIVPPPQASIPTEEEREITPPRASVPTKEEREPSLSMKSIYVRGTEVNIRADAGTKHSILTQAKMGDQLEILGEKGSWYHVRLPNGEEGWINKRLTSSERVLPLAEQKGAGVTEGVKTEAVPTDTKEEEESRVAAIKPEMKKEVFTEELSPQEWIIVRIPPDPFGEKKEVDVREGPGTSYKSIAKVKDGNRLAKIGKGEEWYKVRLSNGTEGWIEGAYVQGPKEPEPEAPSSEAIPSPM
ncbi:MAG: SH3 domain-containing protein [Candidatus Binatia bacterium]